MTRGAHEEGMDQAILRHCIGLSSSFLVSDTTTDPSHGLDTWSVGFSRLIDIAVALDAQNILELETVNSASRACSECWSVACTWIGLDECKEVLRKVAMRLKKLLDANGRTYRGERIYAP
jgi:hypothetical protein